MGPITLFDKSFLQSLSLDESVWFDAFFIPVICPLFYVETLADLAKSETDRAADTAVRIIAQKTPELSGSPCIFHLELAASNLLGQDVPMDSRIPRPGGRYVMGGGQSGVVYDDSPEMEAYSRWQEERFLEVERSFAVGWRRLLEVADLNEMAKGLRRLGVDGKSCKSLDQAKAMAQEIVEGSSKPYERLGMAVQFFDIPQQHYSPLIERWKALGQPTLSAFAPYAAYALTVEIFFHICIAANLISPERPSNRTDIAYLFYLPFCNMFVSNDKLHDRSAELFLRSNQEFVWGSDLKADLKRLNAHFSALPEEQRDQGVLRMARRPPVDGEFLTTALWRKWISESVFSERDHRSEIDLEKARKLVERLTAFTEGERLSASQIDEIGDAPQAMGVSRRVHQRKGSWYLLPKDLPDRDNDLPRRSPMMPGSKS